MEEKREYKISCWNCGATFNVFESTFCCHSDPTPLCLFCYKCYCDATDEYKTDVYINSPPEFRKLKKRMVGGIEMRLGEQLVEIGKITPANLSYAIEKQPELGLKLGEVLVKFGFISDEELKIFLLDQKTINSVELGLMLPDPLLVEKIGAKLCLKFGIIPIELTEIDNKKILKFAINDKNDVSNIRLCEELSDYILLPSVGKEEEMNILLGKVKAIKEVEDMLILD